MIYWRQKVLLALLDKSPNKTASRTQLVKWLFLLKKEEKIDRHGIFYDFLPYDYGPFSFLAYRDIAALERSGLIRSEDNSFQYTGLEPETFKKALSPAVKQSIVSIIEHYGRLSQQSLVKYVDEKYPWYASKSRTRKSIPFTDVPGAQLGIYSLGYEGLSIDAFLNIISMKGIRTVVDSRNNPISRKYGFSKSTLESKCQDIGLKYYQFTEVGIPSKIRGQAQDKNTLWNFYIQKVLPKASETLNLIAEICRKEPSVLICFEEEPKDCHRHILAREISVRTGLPVIHYNKEKKKWEKEPRCL